ncbi:DNA mismatch repair endonuclease MutL [Clostridium kluyveri]|uniref:DNA mismatch repair protein MutL n=1 Tax=Clostridium kluyveri TaxID=1534 RepID=A0A1L5F7K1_CLOKL|nr:DNA mismatch repair endonuclease MutL [Clostridium kluyveri]APM38985.1 DNA mismatch repair protein MutL [Clostridium kluyveri]
MKRINLLDMDTSNKIAAGEVVEGPSSVVKELLENSIDSGAKNITIEIEDGGQKSIRIIDDGVGIHPEDVEKAFMPHATSKISTLEDLNKIYTMGFRGEALSSIAAVSHVILRSKVKDEFNYGREISISGGVLNYIQDTGCNIGTTVLVKDLFFNVPARKKFLKSSGREGALISDIINRLSLANPNIVFKFFRDGKKSLVTYGSGELMDVIRCIYGKNIYENIIPIENHSDIVSIYGYIGNSEVSRGSRNNQSIFVNKRYVKDKSITAAVEKAFKSFLTVNKFPFFVLFLELFPEFVDINVHPAKWEIKFSDSRMIFKFVFDTIHQALRESLKDSFKIDIIEDKILEKEEESVQTNKIQIPIDLRPPIYESYIKEEYGNNEKQEDNISFEYGNTLEGGNTAEENIRLNDSSKESKISKLPPFKMIGQFNNTYIIAEAASNLYIIDQHAAHEKILFEKYKSNIEKEEVISQILITPVVMELTNDDYACYVENKDVFKKAGFDIELFGNNTINVREVPVILGKPDIKNLFIDIIDNLKNMGSGDTVEVKYLSIATLACRAAIKAKRNLSQVEMEHLLHELGFLEDPFTCPHGRPTIVKFTLNDLEKKFKRIQ